MRVRDRHGQRIGRVGLQFIRDAEQNADHVLNLLLVRGTTADDRLLDFFRRVFGHTQTHVHRRANRRAACLTQLECRIRIACHEHTLDRDVFGPMLANQCAHVIENLLQPQRKCFIAEQFQRGMVHVARLPRRVGVDDAYARALRTRIDAEDSGHGGARPADQPVLRVGFSRKVGVGVYILHIVEIVQPLEQFRDGLGRLAAQRDFVLGPHR